MIVNIFHGVDLCGFAAHPVLGGTWPGIFCNSKQTRICRFFFFFSVIDMGQVLLRMCLRACMRDRTRGIRACAHVCSHKCMSDSHRLGAHAMFVINTNSRHTYCCMYEIL